MGALLHSTPTFSLSPISTSSIDRSWPAMSFDHEKGSSKDEHSAYVSTEPATAPGREGPALYDPPKESFATRLGVNFESFKRAPGSTGGLALEGASVDPLKPHDNPLLQQKMKPRHLQMIAVGGSIGTGLFIGSGQALRNGGPAGILIAWAIIGVMLINVTQALGEMCILYPVSGGFYTLAVRFLDPGFGMALGWNYWAQWAVVLPLEITAAGITVQYWEGAQKVPIAAWITIFWFAIIAINVFGTLGYAEEEFWSSCLKLAVVVIFIIIGIVLNCGGGKNEFSEYVGGRYWQDPGAFANGFKGVCAVFVTAAFSFSGTELVGLAAAESTNPGKQLPGAIKQVFWRITLFYILSLLFVSLLVPYDEPRLIGGGGASASPFVIAAFNADLIGFDHFMNVVILVSVISIGNSGVYGGSRTLTALAEQGYAPKIFAYIDRAGRPLFSTIAILAFGLLGYMNLAATGETVFNWLLSLSGLAALFTWGSICLAHIRFRKAWVYHGHTLDEIPFKAVGGVYGSWIGLLIIFLVLVAQFWTAIAPVGGNSEEGAAYGFFYAYLALPVVLAFWAAGYFWKKQGWLRTHQIDVDSGRREHDWERINAWKAELASMPAWKRLLHAIF